jgi:hypothetical protein
MRFCRLELFRRVILITLICGDLPDAGYSCKSRTEYRIIRTVNVAETPASDSW